MGARGLLVVVLVVTLSTVCAEEACSEHGSIVDGKCVCNTPLPVDDSPGWVGNKCAIRVHHLTLDGKDVQETCGNGHICNVVTPTEPVCFSAGIAGLESSAFYLNLLFTSNEVGANVVLQGLLTNFTSTLDPTTGATAVVPQMYPNADAPYSFSTHVSQGSTGTQLKLTRQQLGYGAYTGLYLCVRTDATTIVSLRAAEHTCPFDLFANGTLQLCSGRSSSDACPHGICTCLPPYNPPSNWVVTPGLGFEDCSTALMQLQPSIPLTVPELAPGGWVFYRVEVPESGGRELHVWAATAEATKGSLVLYLRHQQLPGDAAGQHELASDSAAAPFPTSWWHDQSAHLILRRRESFFQTGTWYLGVHNKGVGPVSFSVGSALHDCPNNCSDRGTCDATTGKCICSEPTAPVSADCSIALHELELDKEVVMEPRQFTFDELVLRGIRDKLQVSGATRVKLAVSFTTTDPDSAGLPSWVNGRPVVLAAPSLEAALNQTAADRDGGAHPLHPQGTVESLALSTHGVSYSMNIGSWTVGDDGSLRVVIWNPLSSPLRQVGYRLAVLLQTECPGECSGHGTCNTTTGQCTCEEPYTGADCSVDPSSRVCTNGTSRSVRREGVRGLCWVPCREDGRSFDDESCDDLQCDGPGEGHGQLRRKGTEVECVEDMCVAGNYTVVDPSGDFLCTRRCVCPEDGSACTMEGTCLAGTNQCLKGLRLAEDGVNCVAAGACEEGSLKRAYDMEGGSIFSVCQCTAAGNPASCSFSVPTLAAGNANGVVSCLPGYERQSSTSTIKLSDGNSVVVGGTCGRPRKRGVSGGMVFFYCLLSIFLAAGLVVGGKYGVLWYEQYRYGRSIFSQGYVSWPLFGIRGNAGSGTDDW
ncbi:hypothetical protein Vretifemale_11557 [Volvox reticuliferus]|uniref:EGF-like domain-containing protein n=1 Tax=Volvox reticuliferus TaxID=1737510 RepID=A0A8J4FQ46_9CHLO|nr:hypothetical protein Vretifemale_11557 [Volvox reticuliferus]